MEDVITANPPPSRFLLEDLNNFTTPSPPLPNPFIIFSLPHKNTLLTPSLFIIATSLPSINFFHQIPSKTLVGTLILPEIPFSGNTIEPSLKNKSCDIYSLDFGKNSVLVISVQFPIPAERSHYIAKLLIGERIIPENVLILESVQGRNFRGKLSSDKPFAYKLETSQKRNNSNVNEKLMLKCVDYFPSGSVIEGLGAALLSRCEMKKVKGTLCVTWPEFGGPVASLVKSLMLKYVLPGVEYKINGEDEEANYLRLGRTKDHYLDSDLYT